MKFHHSNRLLAVLLSAVIALPMAIIPAKAAATDDFDSSSSGTISYQFSGSGKSQAGYAEGTVTLTVHEDAAYRLYWANNTKALDGYYPIGEFSLKAGESRSVRFGYHTVIPKDATKIIATTGSLMVSDAYATFTIPSSKRLSSASGKLLYTFSAFSDLHIDEGTKPVDWTYAQRNLKKGLELSAEKNVDYIVVSGDCVTNSSLNDEWNTYQKAISQSNYVNPIWESVGNHELKADVSSGLSKFIKATGTNGTSNSKPYFSMTEEKTGDLFIFMALEQSPNPNLDEVFSDKQIAWAKDLISKNYSQRNIFLVEHAPIKGFGAGDRMSKPYYGGLMDGSKGNNGKFKKLLEDYPDMVFLSGHTHEDFTMDYNYSDEHGTAANMIHIPSLAGTTVPDPNDDTKLFYDKKNGLGKNSQGYYVQVFENEIVFNGMNITEKKIYPAYSYIMEGGRTSGSSLLPEAPVRSEKNVTVPLTQTLSDVSGILSKYDQYASYDSYQSLKKYYFQYRNQTTADESVRDEFNDRIEALSVNTGGIQVPSFYDQYSFVNNYNWSSVYAYAWDGSTQNAPWPGVRLTKSGVNSFNQDIYKISFNRKGEYKYLIFNNGSNAKQTVDISLTDYQYNGFYISGSKNGKYLVSDFATNPQDGEKQLVLLYYVKGEHDWDKQDFSLRKDSDGIYKGVYHPTSDKPFSFSVYDSSSKNYYSLSESVSYTASGSRSFNNTLKKMSTRGKSITINGLSSDYLLSFEYDPTAHSLTTTCQYYITEPLENTSAISSESIRIGSTVTMNASAAGGTHAYTYAFLYSPVSEEAWTVLQDFGTASSCSFKPSLKGDYYLCIKVRDSSGNVVAKTFFLTVFPYLKNTSTTASEIALKDSIIIHAKATGGLGSYQFAVYYKREENTKWVKKQSYSENSTITVKPQKATTYDICVRVKDTRNVVVKKYFKVSVTIPVNTSKLSAATITLGKSFVIKCSASYGAGNYQYQVYYKRASSEKWTLKQKYSSNTTVTMKPTAATTYQFCVRAKDANGNVTKKYFNGTVKKA